MKELFEDIAAFFNDGVKLNGGQEEALPASPRSDAIEDTGCPFIFRATATSRTVAYRRWIDNLLAINFQLFRR